MALGGNLGDVRVTFERALQWLNSEPNIAVEAVSAFHETVAVGIAGEDASQPAYLNGVARITTALSPLDLLRVLQQVELAAGRDRSASAIRWAPRRLDLDLLLFGDAGELVLGHRTLTLPHPRLAERAFVLTPLAELNPDLVHPVTGATVAQLAARLPEH